MDPGRYHGYVAQVAEVKTLLYSRTRLTHLVLIGFVTLLCFFQVGCAGPSEEERLEAARRAVYGGSYRKVLRLIKQLDDVDADISGSTLLETAAMYNLVEIAEALIEKGADVNKPGRAGGMTPLGWVYGSGSEKFMRLLIENGADVNVIKEIDAETAEKNEVVMLPGMSITALTDHGRITITAETPLKRTYAWKGDSRWIVMWPRVERWYGSFGLYFPGPGNHWNEHDGITRILAEEGQQHFDVQDDALAWIESRDWLTWVYNDKGLCVARDKGDRGHTMKVEVWQILIDGEKTDALPGSQNNRIWVTYDPTFQNLK